MEYDAFDAGIELGGLRNRDDIRLLICYLLKSVDAPMTRQMLNEAMQEDGLANYFEVGQAIEELLKTGNITADILEEDEVISVTQKGREAAELLQTSLPRTVREKAVNSAIRLTTRAKIERENKIEVKKEDNGEFKRNEHGEPASPDRPGYPNEHYRKVIEETGDKYKVLF